MALMCRPLSWAFLKPPALPVVTDRCDGDQAEQIDDAHPAERSAIHEKHVPRNGFRHEAPARINRPVS